MNKDNMPVDDNEQNLSAGDKVNNKEKKASSVVTRCLSGSVVAVVYVAVVLLTLLVSTYVFDAFVLLIMVLTSYELAKAISNKYSKPLLPVVIVTAFVGYAVFLAVHIFFKGSGGVTSYFLVLTIVIIAVVVYNMFSEKCTMNNVLSTVFCLLYPLTALFYMLGVNYLPTNYAKVGVILAFVLPTATDTFAYLFGMLLRGPKLIPSVSPNKTISGAIGGILGSIGCCLGVMLLANAGVLGLQPISSSRIANIVHFVMIGFGGAIFVQIGDLVASYIKRQCEIKDYGKFIAGHGGALDRVDSMIFAGVFLFAYLSILAL